MPTHASTGSTSASAPSIGRVARWGCGWSPRQRRSRNCGGAGRTHEQLAGELTRRLSALDARLARLDAVPGEVQSLRTAVLQEGERTVASLRAADERMNELSWVPGEFQEARKRIIALTSGMQDGQDRLRQLEAAIGSLEERIASARPRAAEPEPPGMPG